MSYLEKLLNGAQVERKSLGEIGEFVRGKRFVKTDILSEGIPCIHYGEMYTYYGVWADKAKSFLSAQIASKLRTATTGDVVFVAAGESIEDIGKATAWLGDDEVVIHDACFFYKSSLNPKYVAYFSRTRSFHDQIKSSISSGKISAINARGLEKVMLPVPPLEIQNDIVRILDMFTELTAELTAELKAELTARKKQYEYYREALLSFEEGGVEWKSLIEVCDYVDYRGKTPTKTSNGIFLVTARNIRKGYIDYDAAQEFISEDDYRSVMRRGVAQLGDVLITTEAPCGFVAQVDRENIALAQRVIKYRSKDTRLSNDFLKHYLLGPQFQNKLMAAATGSTVKGIKGSKLHQLTIPILAPKEQARIVSILDVFDTLATSISESLPKEIAQRKAQYEYYREQLLAFNKS